MSLFLNLLLQVFLRLGLKLVRGNHKLAQVCVDVLITIWADNTWDEEHLLDVIFSLFKAFRLRDTVIFEHLSNLLQLVHFDVHSANFAIPDLQSALHYIYLITQL